MIIYFIALYLVECVSTQWCPDVYHFTNSSGNLKSPKPHGALLYPDNTSCNWTITIPGSHVHVQLSFKTFHLENCIECNCDYVEVFDYTGPKQTSLGKFCGSVLPGPFFSSQQTLSIVFKSDHGNSFTGFTASFSSVLPGAVCRDFTQINSRVGDIHSPEFSSRNYSNNMDCIWQITTPPNTRIELEIAPMSIQSCDACRCDFLEVRDGNDSSDHLLTRLCGTNMKPSVILYSSGRYLWVRFKSDGTISSFGFLAMFKSSVIKGDSCPAVRKYPLKCPGKINVSPSKSPSVCCYHNGPNCCHSGGKRCTDRGSGIRDYCPRPNDNKQLKYCCVTSEGKPSCCVSSAVCPKIRFIIFFEILTILPLVLFKWET